MVSIGGWRLEKKSKTLWKKVDFERTKKEEEKRKKKERIKREENKGYLNQKPKTEVINNI